MLNARRRGEHAFFLSGASISRRRRHHIRHGRRRRRTDHNRRRMSQVIQNRVCVDEIGCTLLLLFFLVFLLCQLRMHAELRRVEVGDETMELGLVRRNRHCEGLCLFRSCAVSTSAHTLSVEAKPLAICRILVFLVLQTLQL